MRSSSLIVVLAAICTAIVMNKSMAMTQDLTEVCKVLDTPGEFDGKDVEIRAVYAQYEHGVYLFPYPRCESSAIRAARIRTNAAVVKTWRDAGGTKGTWILATMRGKVKLIGTHELTFTVESIRDPQKVEPYDLSKR
jgi:hypothetical protein